MTNKIKKIVSILLTASVLTISNGRVLLAQEVPPTPPAAPTAPTPPVPGDSDVPPTPPAPPTISDPESLPPVPPTIPTPPVAPDAPTTPDSEEDDMPVFPVSTDTPGDSDQGQTTYSEGAGSSLSGQSGDTTLITGDATTSGSITTNGNSNILVSPTGNGGSVSVVNTGNGNLSDNDVSASIGNSDTTNQGNSAVVSSDLNQNSVSGQNSTSFNSGNSYLETGDANTTGTILTAVNTNVDGIAVSEFNVVDDHVGNIILDFAANCVSGCGDGSVAVENTDNGALSTNNLDVATTSTDTTNQANSADVASNLTLGADSGNNAANFNTGGDSTIVTGDANVAGNILTFANNNIAGNVIVGVVNIFGDLVGDIILSEESLAAFCGNSCGGSTTVTNANNGDGSVNNQNVAQTTTDETFQSNDATIENNLILSGETGENDTNFNTGGGSTILTGEANVTGSVLNVANSNVLGGNWWLVIVNEAGRWVGRLMGSPDGANYAASPGTEFIVDANGEVTAVNNSGNGDGSTNTTNVAQSSDSTTNQSNDAHIVNNVNLSANTGGNSASLNTGGDSTIVTGDANVIASIVNFVNNNIAGSGKLVVTIVNVFGTWIGDFVTPGNEKDYSEVARGGESSSTNNSSSSQETQSQDSSEDNAINSSDETPLDVAQAVATYAGGLVSGYRLTQASLVTEGETGDKLAGVVSEDILGAGAQAKKTIKLNLAWLIVIVPLFVGYRIVRKRVLAA